MSNCPFCEAPLGTADLQAGSCPACHRPLTLAVDVDEPAPPTDQDETDTSEATVDQTIDEVDQTGRPQGVGRRTVADLTAATVDLSQAAPQPAGEDQAPGDAFELAADSGETAEPPQPPGTGTIDSRAGAPTVDWSGPREAAPAPKPATVPDRRVAPTQDLGPIPADAARRVQQTWQRTASQPGVTIQTSLKADVAIDTASPTTLVIRPRALRRAGAAAGGAADYDLLQLLGKGGMGIVYAARQASIDRTVAIKMLKPSTAADTGQRNKFLSEACVTGDLEHPNIVPIYDLGRNAEGALFYAMKRVQGTPWDQVIGDKSLPENIEILMKVCDAVAFAHSRGVIHRDLKPENVMLGGFGEVLLMDWGLAVPTDRRRTIAGIKPSVSMGGTPAYMAPEMATGPFDRIGPASDVYLLGAILYEIIAGQPPHTGPDVMKCLVAAARNEIQPTDRSGELLDIALRAMQSSPADRYPSVPAFQEAIRDYQSHSESIALSTRAAEHLAEAAQTDDYQDYALAMFGFQQAIDLWDGNAKAKSGLTETRLAYAKSAQAKGDYDLAASLLDLAVPEHAQLHRDIMAAQQERAARQQRLKTYKRIGAALVATFLVFITGAAIWINYERAEAVRQRELAKRNEAEAVKQKAIAEAALQKAIEQERIAKRNEAEATRQRGIAEANLKRAIEQEMLAKKNAAEAIRQKGIAETNLQKAIEQEKLAKKNEAEAIRQKAIAEENLKRANQQERLAKKNEAEALRQKGIAEQQRREAVAAKEAEAYEAYVARIGAAAAKIDENAYESARELLRQCIPAAGEKDHRNWEWGRLWYLCHQASKTLDAQVPLECVAFAPGDAGRLAAGGWGGLVYLWQTDGKPLGRLNAGGRYVYAVAFSPDGRYVATGTDDPDGFVKIFDAQTGRLVQTLVGTRGKGHSRPVLSVEFSGDGRRLLTGSYDETAKLWDLASGEVIRTLHGHSWWVWNARFCPERGPDGQPLPEKKVVTVSQDGMAIVWTDPTGRWTDERQVRQSPRFRGHDGPIYAAAFSPDGQTVATGGYDKRILLWKIKDLTEFDYRAATDQFLVSAERRAGGEPAEISPPQYRALRGHTAAIRSLAFSRDGRLLVSAGHDNTVKVWDVASGKSLRTLRGHGEWVRGCAISPDGQSVLSASYDRQVRLWDIAGYQEVRVLRGRVLQGHEDSILAAAFSRQGDRIVTASRDRTIKTWDFRTGKELRSFREGHAFLASNAVFFPDGLRLATAAVDNTVRIWDVATGAEILVLQHTGRTAALAVSRDGKWLLTGGPQVVEPASGESIWLAQLWDAQTGQLVRKLKGHSAQVSVVAFSYRGDYLFTGDVDGVGILWDAQTGKREQLLGWHGAKIIAARFLADDRRLLTASIERAVAQWDFRAGMVDQSRLLLHPSSLLSMDASPDGKYVLTSCMDNKVRLWDLETGEVVRTLSGTGPDGLGQITKVAMVSTPARRLALAVNSEARTVRLFDLATGQEIVFPTTPTRNGPFLKLPERSTLRSASFSVDGQRVVTVGGDQARLWDLDRNVVQWKRERMSYSPHGAVASAQFSSDGRSIVSGSWDGSARIWDAETGQDKLKLVGQHARAVNCAVFSPDRQSKFVLTASDDGTALVWKIDWDSKTARPVLSLQGHRGAVLWAEFSSDGRRVLTASEDRTARIWDVKRIRSGQPPERLEVLRESQVLHGHDRPVRHAAFSRDGRWVVTASEDNTAKIWDLQTGRAQWTLAGHTASVTSAAFSPDGLRVLTGSEDYTAKLWDATTGKEIMTLKGHQQEITSVAFSRDGRYGLTASHDGTAIVWLASSWDQTAGTGQQPK